MEAVLNDNQRRVEFRKPEAKNIVSRHSGSILATEEPQIELPADLVVKLRENFSRFSTVEGDISSIPFDKVSQYFIDSGILRADLSCTSIVSKRSSKFGSTLGEESCIELAKLIFAPTYYYGNRLRRNVCRGEISEIIELIVRGCNPNCADGEGLTPLHYAAEFGKSDSIYCLFDTAGDVLKVDSKDKYGWTPLFSAVHHGNHKCVRLLLKFGASVHLTDNNGKTSLHIACAQNRGRICDTLVNAGAKIDSLDNNNMSPLHDAAFNGHKGLFNRLCTESGITSNNIDRLGFTALTYLTMNPTEEQDELVGDKDSAPPTPREFPPTPEPIATPAIEEPSMQAAVAPEAKSTKKGKK